METTALHQYAVFTGDNYYPAGGWRDFKGSYRTLEEAVEAAEAGDEIFRDYTAKPGWYQVVDLSDASIVAQGYLPAGQEVYERG